MSANYKGKKGTQISHQLNDVKRYVEQMKDESQKYNMTIENIFKKMDKAFDNNEAQPAHKKK